MIHGQSLSEHEAANGASAQFMISATDPKHSKPDSRAQEYRRLSMSRPALVASDEQHVRAHFLPLSTWHLRRSRPMKAANALHPPMRRDCHAATATMRAKPATSVASSDAMRTKVAPIGPLAPALSQGTNFADPPSGLRCHSMNRAFAANGRNVRGAVARPSKMLRDEWTSGLVKLRCSTEHSCERPQRAGRVPIADHGAQLCKAFFLREGAARP